jgi:hypothetical protein
VLSVGTYGANAALQRRRQTEPRPLTLVLIGQVVHAGPLLWGLHLQQPGQGQGQGRVGASAAEAAYGCRARGTGVQHRLLCKALPTLPLPVHVHVGLSSLSQRKTSQTCTHPTDAATVAVGQHMPYR